jgi:hypothetical protein
LDALKEFPVEGALNVLTQFLDSNLEHVSNKSAYLCGVMKTYRQKSRAGQGSGSGTVAKAPDEDKIKVICCINLIFMYIMLCSECFKAWWLVIQNCYTF